MRYPFWINLDIEINKDTSRLATFRSTTKIIPGAESNGGIGRVVDKQIIRNDIGLESTA